MSVPSPLVSFNQIHDGSVPLASAVRHFDRVVLASHGRFVACAFDVSSIQMALTKAAVLAEENLSSAPLPIPVTYSLDAFRQNAERLVTRLLTVRTGRVMVLTVAGRPRVGLVALHRDVESRIIPQLHSKGTRSHRPRSVHGTLAS